MPTGIVYLSFISTLWFNLEVNCDFLKVLEEIWTISLTSLVLVFFANFREISKILVVNFDMFVLPGKLFYLELYFLGVCLAQELF